VRQDEEAIRSPRVKDELIAVDRVTEDGAF
jgi:hypothetical protein